MLKLTNLLLIVSFVRSFGFELSPNYENQTAIAKQEELWSIMEEGKGSSGSYPFFLTLLYFAFFEDIEGTVTHFKDSLPYNHSKRIHSVGGVTKGIWKNVGDHNYTGLFGQNETLAMVRLSLASRPRRMGTIPGIGVKLFRDGIPSANLVAMNSLERQGSGNFFERNFSNHVDPLPPLSPTNLLGSAFDEISSPGTMVGLSDIAAFNGTGEAVENIQSPFRLEFVPNFNLTEKFEDKRPRCSLEEMLVSIESGTKLYDIYAYSDPDSVAGKKIGELYTSSEIIYSESGDNFLFFRHQKMMEDVALRPDWEDSIDFKQGRRLLACPHLRANVF